MQVVGGLMKRMHVSLWAVHMHTDSECLAVAQQCRDAVMQKVPSIVDQQQAAAQ